MNRIFVQGDRDAHGLWENLVELGNLCAKRGIGLNVGAAGQIVKVLAGTEANVRVHTHTLDRPNVPDDCHIELVNAGYTARSVPSNIELLHHEIVERHVEISENILAWAIRLAVLASSDGFIFFPGRAGTMAHLVPIMAHLIKHERGGKSHPHRRVALVGWNHQQVNALGILMQLGPHPSDADWIQNFVPDEAGVIDTKQVLDFVAAGFLSRP